MALIEESHALAVPDALPWPEAGGFPEVFSTAFDALFTRAGLSMGERVLVSGAAGGVGTAGVQLAAAAGAITFLSPCCLPLVPGYLSYATGMSGADAQQADGERGRVGVCGVRSRLLAAGCLSHHGDERDP